MGFRYFLAQNQIEDYEDICLLMLNEEGKQVYHIIARILNISKYFYLFRLSTNYIFIYKIELKSM